MGRPSSVTIGNTYNYLKVLKRIGVKKNKTIIWECECTLCGNHTNVSSEHIKDGSTKSCGCFRKQRMIDIQSRENTYTIDGDVVTMYDEQGNYFLIDLEDLDRVKQHYWSVTNRGYVRCSKERMFLHRFILNTPDGYVVDHRNHKPYDNRKCNIWSCTQSDNMLNQKRFHKIECYK